MVPAEAVITGVLDTIKEGVILSTVDEVADTMTFEVINGCFSTI